MNLKLNSNKKYINLTIQVTNLSNASALIYYALNSILSKKKSQPIVVNWTGFYLNDKNNPGTLFLGPFQGKVKFWSCLSFLPYSVLRILWYLSTNKFKVACSMIKFGKGVCGTAAKTLETQVVPNVNLFPGHIACDSESQSEIVVPIMSNDKVTYNLNCSWFTEYFSLLNKPKSCLKLVGVLDIDALLLEVFDEEDKKGLENICNLISNGCDWNNCLM